MSDTMEVEVNGKIDLGTRRLVVSHIENATSFFAYFDSHKEFMEEIKQICKKMLENAPKLTDKPVLEQLVGVYSSSEKSWFRGKIEQLGQGRGKNQFRVRIVDFGWNNLFNLDDLCELPETLKSKELLCEKYRMADLKPKGRADGYSAEDRQRGGEWLKRTINNRVVICSCYKQVKYAGGIMADCMVADINLNKAALKQGHALLVPSIIGSFQNKKMNSQDRNVNKNLQFNQNQMRNNFQNMGMGPGNIDLDYSSYNGSTPFMAEQRGRTGHIGQPRPLIGQTNGKSVVVKKLERKINEDKKTINVLKKTTNLDVGIKDISRLLGKVNQARGNNPDKEAKGNYILSSLVGVAEVIEESSEVSSKYLGGVEAVEAACRLVNDEDEAAGDASRIKAIKAKTDLYKCVSQYLEEYTDEVLDDELYKVNSQLTTITPNIPTGWKLLVVKADAVTRANLLEVSENVKTWMEESVSREAALTANSKKEVESLCLCLDQLSAGLREKEGGSMDAEVPSSIDSQLGSTRRALQAELTGRTGGMVAAAKKGKEKIGSNDAMVLKSAWKALTALRGQLEIAKAKKVEYETLLATLAPNDS